MLWKPYTRSGSFLYQRDVKIVHDFDAIFLIYKPIIDVLMKKSSLIDLNVFRKVLIGLGISSSLFYPNNALADSYLTSKNEVTTTV